MAENLVKLVAKKKFLYKKQLRTGRIQNKPIDQS